MMNVCPVSGTEQTAQTANLCTKRQISVPVTSHKKKNHTPSDPRIVSKETLTSFLGKRSDKHAT